MPMKYSISFLSSVSSPHKILDVCVRHRLFPTIKLLCRIPLSQPPSNILSCPGRSLISSYKMVLKWQTFSQVLWWPLCLTQATWFEPMSYKYTQPNTLTTHFFPQESIFPDIPPQAQGKHFPGACASTYHIKFPLTMALSHKKFIQTKNHLVFLTVWARGNGNQLFPGSHESDGLCMASFPSNGYRNNRISSIMESLRTRVKNYTLLRRQGFLPEPNNCNVHMEACLHSNNICGMSLMSHLL